MPALAGCMAPLVLACLSHGCKDAEAMEGLHERYLEMAIDLLKADK